MSKYFRIRGIEEDEIFRNLFIDYYPSLISFALYYVGDKTIAEDLVQEVFVIQTKILSQLDFLLY